MSIPQVTVRAVRDDIHKSAPVPPAWRQVVKYSTREADRDERAEEAAKRAMLKDWQNEVSETFLSELKQKCSDRQSVMFNGKLDELTGVSQLGGTGHVLEQTLLDTVRRLGQSGQLTEAVLTQAVEETIGARCESRERAMTGHVLKDGGKGVRECVASLKGAIGSISRRQLAELIVMNNGKVQIPRAKKGVDLNENLLKRKP